MKGELRQGMPQKQLYDSKRGNLVEPFLGTYNPPRQSHEERDDLSRPVTTEIESVIANLPTEESPGPDSFAGEFYQTFKESTPILLQSSQR